MDLRRLLISFIGLALIIVVLFAILAYRIANETAYLSEQDIIENLASREIEELTRALQQGLEIAQFISSKNSTGSGFVLLIGDRTGHLFEAPGKLDFPFEDVNKLLQEFSDEQINTQMTLELDGQSIPWSRKKLPQSDHFLYLFSVYNVHSHHWKETLGTRLLVTSLIILWIAVWASLVLFGAISRRTKKLEDARRKSDEQVRLLSQVIKQTSDAVFITDSKGTIEYVNAAFERMSGFSEQEIVGENAGHVSSTFKKGANSSHIWRALGAGRSYTSVSINQRKNKDEYYAQEIIAPLKGDDGEICNIVYTCRDVSVQIEQEAKFQSIIIEKQSAEQANREKSSFLAKMSHELRTPLNAIIGYGELLEEELSETNQTELTEDIRKIQFAGNHLLNLINDILDFSKIEAGKMELCFQPIKLSALMEEVTSIAKPIMEKQQTHFVTEQFDGELEMVTDRLRLKQSLLNLLSNAAKFAASGEVKLAAYPYAKKGENWILFSVIDNGIGISNEQQAKLFSEFFQAEANTNLEYGGTGLGLAISRRLVNAMGGEISLRSRPGKGSTFIINVPVIQGHNVNTPSLDSPSPSTMTIEQSKVG